MESNSSPPDEATLILRVWFEGARFHARVFGVSGYGPPHAGRPDSAVAFANPADALAYTREWLHQFTARSADTDQGDRPTAGPNA